MGDLARSLQQMTQDGASICCSWITGKANFSTITEPNHMTLAFSKQFHALLQLDFHPSTSLFRAYLSKNPVPCAHGHLMATKIWHPRPFSWCSATPMWAREDSILWASWMAAWLLDVDELLVCYFENIFHSLWSKKFILMSLFKEDGVDVAVSDMIGHVNMNAAYEKLRNDGDGACPASLCLSKHCTS